MEPVAAPVTPELKVDPAQLETKLPDAGTSKPDEAVESKAEDSASKKEVVTPERPYKIKVNGEERAASLDEILKLAQKAEGAEKKFQEAYKMRKQSESLIRMLKERPLDVLRNPNIGIDVKKMAEDYLYEEIKKQQMSPQERELFELKQKMKEVEDEKQTSKQREEQEKFNNLVAHYNEHFDREISTALKDANLPKSESTVKRVAYYLSEGLRRGVQLKPSDVIDIVRQDYVRDITSLFAHTDGETLTKLLGEPNLKKIRESELKRVRPNDPPQPVGMSQQPQRSEIKKLDPMSWREQLEKDFGR